MKMDITKRWLRASRTEGKVGVPCIFLVGALVMLIVAIVATINTAIESYRALKGKEAYSQMAAVREGLYEYFDEHGQLPPISADNHDGIRTPSWKTALAEFTPDRGVEIQRLPIYALSYNDSVWMRKYKIKRLRSEFGRQVIFIYCYQTSGRIMTHNACIVLADGGRLKIQGMDDVFVDPRGAMVLRVDGSIERIPTELAIADIVHRLVGGRGFYD